MHVSSSEDLTAPEDSIGYTFRDKTLLKEALTHKSFVHEKKKKRDPFNERLEFLGDAVLELIISEYLFSSFCEYTEADLSRIKAYAVQESTLAETASQLNIGSYLRLGKGEEITGGRKKPSLLSNAYEAILAAIYIDGGYEEAKSFVLSNLKEKIDELAKTNFVFDFKTKLQEIVQANFNVLPKYITHREEGPEHKKIFEVKVYINEELYGSGLGKTKKAAAQKAAESAMNTIRDKDETDL